ncbi:hypothetical protein DBV05_g9306 [Lasiodiplodia theobromae]|uniref:Uncharacterized protein n=2 Tax=Lasiodiplodia theobromae TaxID=45133 RepID=A0A5N5D305_9PEZI|nr:hypothetical protein DBV05_g9306 [Lasiodiplodia theobromae]
MTDESDDSAEELSDEDDDDYESDSEGDEEDESSKKPSDCGLDEVSGLRLQRTRQMHFLHNTVTLCRLARVIASVEQRGAELLAKDVKSAACAGDTKAKILAQLQNAADEARVSWAKEMQRELEVAEQYRIAMIQVLQDELRR